MTNIKAIRESCHMTQEELAQRLNISRTTVTMWETGQNTPPTRLLLRIAEALDCTVEAILATPAEANDLGGSSQ